MNKKLQNRNGFIHLYNPKEEGLGSYDIHYINAHKKNNKVIKKQNYDERYAAWFHSSEVLPN